MLITVNGGGDGVFFPRTFITKEEDKIKNNFSLEMQSSKWLLIVMLSDDQIEPLWIWNDYDAESYSFMNMIDEFEEPWKRKRERKLNGKCFLKKSAKIFWTD